MKKILLFLVILISVQRLQAQVIEDFENWNSYSVLFTQLTEPNGWSGSDSFVVGYGKLLNPNGTFQAQIFQDNPGQAGTGALRVASKFQDAINAGIGSLPAKDYPGICTNSSIAINFTNNSYTQVGGSPLTVRPVSTSMYVKNTVVGGDSTFINVLLIDDSDGADSIIATADTILTTNINSFTQITIPFIYTGSSLTPTVVRYTIASANPLALLDSANIYSVHSGTEIVVDNINVNTNTGLRQFLSKSPVAKVYPTTGSDVIYVDFLKEMQGMHLEIYQINGQLVQSQILKGKLNSVSVNSLPSGSYIYAIKSDEGVYQTGKLLRE